jgi:hypothetical protein
MGYAMRTRRYRYIEVLVAHDQLPCYHTRPMARRSSICLSPAPRHAQMLLADTCCGSDHRHALALRRHACSGCHSTPAPPRPRRTGMGCWVPSSTISPRRTTSRTCTRVSTSWRAPRWRPRSRRCISSWCKAGVQPHHNSCEPIDQTPVTCNCVSPCSRRQLRQTCSVFLGFTALALA